ncbi:tripartite tricarboxylate transporter substrate binding protein [Orrella sp. JC864]|uniref:Bug family tripartite tricarboxylate transporter substrate binding protein n=1 Tax=Orrella sp. JC864 TaxID=3120298 RepID=UPI00300862C4
MKRSLKRYLAAPALLLALVAGHAGAQDYPDRRLSIVVPFSPGGSTDIVARLLANALTGELGQPVIVENKAGASGNIAGDYVARSKPDGYTLFMGTSTSIANIALFSKLPFDIEKDFVPVSQIVHTPLVLITNLDFPAATVRELIDYARANPGRVNYGSGGAGTSQHLAGVMFEHLAQVKMTHVPYKGAAPAVTDLMGGSIQVMFAPLIDALSFIRAGKVKALGLTTTRRAPQVPDVAPIADLLPGFEVATWNGVFAPADTPPERIGILSQAIVKAVALPETRRQIEEQGSAAVGSTPAQFRAFLDDEVVLWRRLVEMSGARAD